MFNRIKPLRVGGGDSHPMRAQDFLTLASNYVSAINKGAIPTITDAWTEIAEGQAR